MIASFLTKKRLTKKRLTNLASDEEASDSKKRPKTALNCLPQNHLLQSCLRRAFRRNRKNGCGSKERG